VERISKDITGSIVLDLTHFPVNADGAGLVNLAVANMTPNGITLPSGRNDFSCNVNNDSDVIPSDPGGTGGTGSGGGGDSDVPPEGETPPGAGVPNPGDPVAQAPAPEICGASFANDTPFPGDELEVCDAVCEGQYNEWYLCDESPTVGATTVIHPSCVKISEGEGAKLIISPDNLGKRVLVVGRCPDPSSPDGYGEPQLSPYTPPVGGEKGKNYWGKSVPGQDTRVQFVGYTGNWLIGIGGDYEWLVWAVEQPNGSLQYFEAGINESGNIVSVDCIPATLTNNCQSVLTNTQLIWTQDGVPFTPNNG
jgi:hypothetical protein